MKFPQNETKFVNSRFIAILGTQIQISKNRAQVCSYVKSRFFPSNGEFQEVIFFFLPHMLQLLLFFSTWYIFVRKWNMQVIGKQGKLLIGNWASSKMETISSYEAIIYLSSHNWQRSMNMCGAMTELLQNRAAKFCILSWSCQSAISNREGHTCTVLKI